MAGKPFDATLKELIEADPRAWAELATGRTLLAASLIDADVSTVTAAADKVFRVETADGPCLLNLEVESSWAGEVPERLHFYGTVLEHRHGLPAIGVVLLLRPEANATAVTGERLRFHPGATVPYDVYRYTAIPVWKLPLSLLLAGPVATLPLAPITDEAAPQLEGVVHQIEDRYQAEATAGLSGMLSTATAVLLGLRYSEEVTLRLYEGVTKMEESSTYQWIKRKGRDEARVEVAREVARRLLLTVGITKFGPPDPATRAAIDAIADPTTLEALVPRVLSVSSWQELISLPVTTP
jgi:predicted transposase YdaD